MFFCFSIIITCCKQSTPVEKQQTEPASSCCKKTADQGDTVINDAIILNPDPEDTWTTECLKDLRREKLIDQLFAAVYAGKATAYDHETEQVLKSDEVKKIEQRAGNERSKIGKLQFIETWIYDSISTSLTKKVIAVTLGYELRNEQGEFRGHKAGIKIKLNTN